MRARASMLRAMRSFLKHPLFATTVAVAIAVKATGMDADGWFPVAVTALLLAIINSAIRPVLLLLSLPFIVVTLGLFILVLNALILWVAGGVVPGFHVNGFGNALFGSIIVSIVNSALGAVFHINDGGTHIAAHRTEITTEIKRVEGRVIESDSRG